MPYDCLETGWLVSEGLNLLPISHLKVTLFSNAQYSMHITFHRQEISLYIYHRQEVL